MRRTPEQLPAPSEGLAKKFEDLESRIDSCTLCPLHKNRMVSVENRYYRGSPTAKIMFIGEAPGAHEQSLGQPFVGPAGRILQEWIEFMGLRNDEYFITNIVKHRSMAWKRNRPPRVEEIRACLPFLREQLRIVRPIFLVSLGRVADRWLDEMGRKHYHIPHPAWFLRTGKEWFQEVEALMEAYKAVKKVYEAGWFR